MERAQPWARLLVLCSFAGPGGPLLGHGLVVRASFRFARHRANAHTKEHAHEKS